MPTKRSIGSERLGLIKAAFVVRGEDFSGLSEAKLAKRMADLVPASNRDSGDASFFLNCLESLERFKGRNIYVCSMFSYSLMFEALRGYEPEKYGDIFNLSEDQRLNLQNKLGKPWGELVTVFLGDQTKPDCEKSLWERDGGSTVIRKLQRYDQMTFVELSEALRPQSPRIVVEDQPAPTAEGLMLVASVAKKSEERSVEIRERIRVKPVYAPREVGTKATMPSPIRPYIQIERPPIFSPPSVSAPIVTPQIEYPVTPPKSEHDHKLEAHEVAKLINFCGVHMSWMKFSLPGSFISLLGAFVEIESGCSVLSDGTVMVSAKDYPRLQSWIRKGCSPDVV